MITTKINLPTTMLFHDEDSIEAFTNTLAMIIPKVKYQVLGSMHTPEGGTQYEAVLYTRKDKKYRELVGEEASNPAEKNYAEENETSNTANQ